MASYSAIKKRRDTISQYLVKGILSPTNLAVASGYDLNLVKNDLAFFKRISGEWLMELAKDGYTFLSHNTADQLQDMIEELQQKRTSEKIKNDVILLIKVDLALVQLLSYKWQLITNGPTMLIIKRAMDKVRNDVM